MTTTWTIAIDWDRNGNYTDPNDDVSNYVVSANWFLGFRQPYKDVAHDSMLELVLNNDDQRFSPERATLSDSSSNPLYGKLAPFRTIRIQSDDDGVGANPARTHWVGWIEKIEPEVSRKGKRTVKITAAGPMMFFEAAETLIELQENQRTDRILGKLIQEVVIPPALSQGWFLELPGYSELDISTIIPNVTSFHNLPPPNDDDPATEMGQVTLAIAADNWVKRGDDTQDTFNVYRAINDVVAAEQGRFLFDRTGRAIFWNRVHLQDDIIPSWTFNNDMNELRYTYAGIEDFKNEVIVTCHPREVGDTADEILWKLTDKVTVKPGETKSVGVKYQDSTTGNIRIGAKEVTVGDVTFKKGSGLVTIEPKANSATLKVTNTGSGTAELSGCTVRGRKITDYGRMEAKAQDGISIAKYGRRSMKKNLQSVDNLEYAQYIADYEVKKRADLRGTIGQLSLSSHRTLGGAHHARQLALTLGDTITISETQTGHNSRRYAIIGEAQRLTDALLETTWYLEPAAEAPFPWRLGDTGRSELGTATYLAF